MVASCWAPGCTNRLVHSSMGIRFYRFPLSNPERLTKWLAAINRTCRQGQVTFRQDGFLEPTQHSRLCSEHFVSGSPSRDQLNVDYTPSIFPDITNGVKQKKRNCIAEVKKQQKIKKIEMAKTLLSLTLMERKSERETSICTQTDRVELSDKTTQTEDNDNKIILQDLCSTQLDSSRIASSS